MGGETKILLPTVEIAHRTDPGRDPQKQVNEDAVGFRETRFGHLAVVCDGMGGHSGGREASNAAVAAMFEAFDEASPGPSPADVLRVAVEKANVRVRGLAAEEADREGAHGRPGSTLVAILLHNEGTEVAHVGDSRVYLVHEGQIFQLTRDHSMVQEMVEARLLTPAQAAVHPEANKITRALGIDDRVEVEVRPQPVPHVAGDTFVLCTDGLHDLVEGPEILAIVGAEPPAQAAHRLVDLANARGGHDNITVLLLRARQTSAARRESVPQTIVQTAHDGTTLRPSPPGAPSPVIPRAPEPAAPARRRGALAPVLGGRTLVILAVAALALVAAGIGLYALLAEDARPVTPASDGGAPLPSSMTLGAPRPSVVALTPEPLAPAPTAPNDLPKLEGPPPDAGIDGGRPPLAPLAPPTVRHWHK